PYGLGSLLETLGGVPDIGRSTGVIKLKRQLVSSSSHSTQKMPILHATSYSRGWRKFVLEFPTIFSSNDSPRNRIKRLTL
ncbi:hypothetical protein PanWU01x14_130680, partial [Parasponia andersonii]